MTVCPQVGMVTTIGSFVPAEYTVWAIAGAIFVTGGLDFFFSFRTSQEEGPSTRDPRRRPPRVLTFLAVAFWGASLILPLLIVYDVDGSPDELVDELDGKIRDGEIESASNTCQST